MKNLTLFILSAAAAGLMALSCSKGDDRQQDQTPPAPAPVSTGSYAYDGTTRDIVSAYYKLTPGRYDLYLAPVRTDFENEPEEYINLEYDEASLGGTINLVKGDAPFWYVRFTRADHAFGYGGVSFSPDDVASGTMSLSRNGTAFTLKFDIAFTDGKTLKGEYDGTMTEMVSN